MTTSTTIDWAAADKGVSNEHHGGWQTAVVFVADALGGWLVGQLAGAGRKNLLAVSTW